MAAGGCVGALAVAATWLRRPARRRPDDQAVQAAVERFLDVLGKRELDALPALFAPKATMVVVRQREGQWSYTTQTFDEWLAGLKAQSHATRFREPLTNVSVHVEDGQLAFLRADFTVVIDGQVRSHGVDYFTLVKDAGAWKIVNGSYTSKTGAPRSPRAGRASGDTATAQARGRQSRLERRPRQYHAGTRMVSETVDAEGHLIDSGDLQAILTTMVGAGRQLRDPPLRHGPHQRRTRRGCRCALSTETREALDHLLATLSTFGCYVQGAPDALLRVNDIAGAAPLGLLLHHQPQDADAARRRSGPRWTASAWTPPSWSTAGAPSAASCATSRSATRWSAGCRASACSPTCRAATSRPSGS